MRRDLLRSLRVYLHVSMRICALVVCLAALPACSTVYYAGLERIGIPKRDLLSRRVESARDAQEDTKEQFRSSLERFRATVHVEAGELEQRYDEMRAELDKSERRAEQLDARIDGVEDVAEALFDEWEDELDDYKRSDLRSASARRLAETRRAYEPMVKAMRKAQRSVEPVLDAFQDVVLALKHQLNARALGSVQGELTKVEREVDALIAQMNRSIGESTKFLETLQTRTE
jgi:hypothetical protein